MTDDEHRARPKAEQTTIPDRTGQQPRPNVDLGSDRYQLVGTIGMGGMGVVANAKDIQLGREVAIKRLQSPAPSEAERKRFLYEARIQARLDHPAVVPVYELDHDSEGRPYFAMKRVAGRTLGELIAPGRATLQRLLRAFADVCLAIEFAHVHGVIHRDLKPENIVVGEFGEVYVLDWGIAKLVGETDEFADLHSYSPGTTAGTVLGTPYYMAPEQRSNPADVDARADVYSLGLVLSAILTIVEDPPPELAELVEDASAVDRDRRTGSARELEQRVQRFLDGDRDLALRRQLARDQLEQAQRAFAGAPDDDEQRRIAFRAASSAMVLDPALTGAAELVSRLMLEPPRRVPREVEAAVVDDDAGIMRAQGRAALWGAAIGLGLIVPQLLASGSTFGAVLFGVVGGLATFAMARAMRDPNAMPPPPSILAIGTAIPIGVVSHLFGPLLVAPAVASLSAVSLAANPFLGRRRAVAFLGAALVAAVVLPAIAEQLGWLAPTIAAVPDGLMLRPALRITESMIVPVATLYALGMVLSAIALGRFTRAHERGLRRQLHVQAWQLRQLVR